MLCVCPQILLGLVPIPQVSEPYSSIAYLAQRVNLVKFYQLEQTNLSLLSRVIYPSRSHMGSSPSDSSFSSSSSSLAATAISWSAYRICEALALKRSYITSRGGRPDAYRAGMSVFVCLPRSLCLLYFTSLNFYAMCL